MDRITSRKNTTASALTMALVAMAAVVLLGACVGAEGGPAQAAPGASDAAPQAEEPTPTPEPAPTATPAPVAQHEPGVSRVEAEYLVLDKAAACVDAVSKGAPEPMRLAFLSDYDPEERAWVIDAENNTGAVTFGTWHVQDRSQPFAAPAERIAERIEAADERCSYPATLLDGGPTPPRFVDFYHALGPFPMSAEQSVVRVWTAVGDCFDEATRPGVGVFSAEEEKPGRWIVEGRGTEDDEVVLYGLWLVENDNGHIVALDEESRSFTSRSCFQRLD